MADVAESPDDLSVENVVVSSGIGRELELERLALDLVGAIYDPESLPAVKYPVEAYDATVLVFRTGKLVCTGADSVATAENAVQETKAALADLDIPIAEVPTTVQNLVTSGTLGESVNLNAAAVGLGLEAVEYEPEQFSALVYRLEEPDTVVLLFGSGRCIITGATSLADARAAFETVREELRELRLLAA